MRWGARIVQRAAIVLAAWPLLSQAESPPPRHALDASTRAQLIERLAQARAQHPQEFTRVARVREAILRERQRGRAGRAPVALWFRPLGKQALMPLLEIAASDDPAPDAASAHALRVGAVEALGSLRDVRAAPVLTSLLSSSVDSPDLQRAVIVALGRIGDDASSSMLAALVERADPPQTVVLSAIGECRRLVVARALERLLRQSADAERTRLAARALGEVGSAWAWRTEVVARSGEGEAVRQLAARALVTLLSSQSRPIREEARKSLLLVAHPSALGLLRDARRGGAAGLDEVIAALERSSIRAGP